MSNFHYENIKNNQIINVIKNKKNQTFDSNLNIINEYLNKYFKYKFKLCIILFDLNDELIKNLNQIDNQNYDIYLINYNSTKNLIKESNININVIYIKDNINSIQNVFLNLNYDYFFIPKNNLIELNLNLVEKNPIIINQHNYIIINKQLFKYYNFYDLYYNIDKYNLMINKSININNDIFFDLKLYNIISYQNFELKNNIYLNLDINNFIDVFYLKRIIVYLENFKYNVFLKPNNYLCFENYF